jgi:hypothetical protein
MTLELIECERVVGEGKDRCRQIVRKWDSDHDYVWVRRVYDDGRTFVYLNTGQVKNFLA